jgi:signal transduction histidine kinase
MTELIAIRTKGLQPPNHWRGALFFLISLLIAPWVYAQNTTDLIESKAYYLDETGSLTLEEVMAKPLIAYTGILTKGYSRAAVWIRLQIDPERGAQFLTHQSRLAFPLTLDSLSDRSDDLVVRVRPPYLDNIRLFDPLEPERGIRETGDATAWLLGEYRSLNHGFLIPRGLGTRDIWLRVQSTSTLIVGVDVLPYAVMQGEERRQEMINNLDIVLILFLIVWGILLFFTRPDALGGAFLLVMVATFFYASNYMGFYRIYWDKVFPVGFSDVAHSIMILIMPAAYLMFHRRLLADYQPKQWMMWLLLPGQYFVFAGLLGLYLGYASVVLPINAMLAGLSLAWICVILMVGIPDGSNDPQPKPLISKYWLLPYYLVLTGIFASLILPAHGLVDANSNSLNRSIIQGLLSFGALAGIVYVRGRMLEQNRQRALMAAEQAAHYEKSKRQERDQFFAMLTHEIRTPLTVMTYAAETNMPEGQLSQHVKEGISEIDQIIERCVQADQADQSEVTLNFGLFGLSELVMGALERFSSHRIQFDGAPEDNETIVTDKAIFQIVLGNLIDNAIKYSPKETEVTIRIKPHTLGAQRGYSVQVENIVGPAGFPDEKKLFDRYYRAPRARNTTGSGLGLYVARSFANRLGGSLHYAPEDNRVVFDLWIPARMS